MIEMTRELDDPASWPPCRLSPRPSAP